MANILIVEDDLETADAVAELLTPAGHVTRTACNGVEGLRMVAGRIPDLILLDVEMPILDGPGMAETLAIERAGQPRIPIVIVSGARNIQKIAAWVGTAHYLRKPFSVEQMLAIVNRALDWRGRSHQRMTFAGRSREMQDNSCGIQWSFAADSS